jgi:hypothetical protein
MKKPKGLQNDKKFLAKLRADEVITPTNPRYDEWKRERQQYEAMLPAPFTERWAQDYGKDAESKPWTWLTAAFLHGSTGHLLGNMLFLFLFGFSVELALGRGTYLAFYLLGAIGASALAGWAYAGKGSYGLGASGAISALMGMYAVMYRLQAHPLFLPAVLLFQLRHGAGPAAAAGLDRQRAHAALARRPGHRLHGPPGRPAHRRALMACAMRCAACRRPRPAAAPEPDRFGSTWPRPGNTARP